MTLGGNTPALTYVLGWQMDGSRSSSDQQDRFSQHSTRQYSFTDHAIERCDEQGLDLVELSKTLDSEHFTQRDHKHSDRLVHLVKVAESRVKVVTAGQVIITAFALIPTPK